MYDFVGDLAGNNMFKEFSFVSNENSFKLGKVQQHHNGETQFFRGGGQQTLEKNGKTTNFVQEWGGT